MCIIIINIKYYKSTNKKEKKMGLKLCGCENMALNSSETNMVIFFIIKNNTFSSIAAMPSKRNLNQIYILDFVQLMNLVLFSKTK